MAELKTKKTTQRAEEFLRTITPLQKQEDGFTLLALFKKITGEDARMWGSSIVGFGCYHYKSARSSQEGDWMLVGFSPRKQSLSLYVLTGSPDNNRLLAKLGKHKTGVGCLYINSLSDVDMEVLAELIETSYRHMKAINTTACGDGATH